MTKQCETVMKKVCQQVPIRVSVSNAYFLLLTHLSFSQGSSSNLYPLPAEVCPEVRDCDGREGAVQDHLCGKEGGGPHQDLQQCVGGEVPTLCPALMLRPSR